MSHSGDFARWPHLGPIRPMAGGGTREKSKLLLFWLPLQAGWVRGLAGPRGAEARSWGLAPPRASPASPKWTCRCAAVPPPAPLFWRLFFCVFLRGPVLICFICFIERPAVFYCALLSCFKPTVPPLRVWPRQAIEWQGSGSKAPPQLGHRPWVAASCSSCTVCPLDFSVGPISAF